MTDALRPQRRFTTWLLLALVLLVASSCSDSGGSDADPDSLGYREVIRLGVREGPGELGGMPMDLLASSDGRLTLLSSFSGGDGLPMRFDPQGQFVEKIGALGQGPGEFLAALAGFFTPEDSLVIHDLRQRRLTVLSPTGEAGRSISFGGGQVAKLIPIAWPDTVLAVLGPFGREGRSFHLVSLSGSDAETLREFGEPWPTEPQAINRFRRFASQPLDGRLWTAANYSYRLTEWSTRGDSLTTLALSSKWFEQPGMGFAPDSIPETRIVAVQQLKGDTLAVGLSVAREGWQKAWDGIDVSHGEFRGPELSGLYEGLIELRNARTGELLGSQRLRGVIFAILPDGRVATHYTEGPGFPFVTVYARSGAAP